MPLKKLIILFLLSVLIIAPEAATANNSCSHPEGLSGRILIQTEENGEAWYVDPGDKHRIYLGRPSDAFRIMGEAGVGVSEKDFLGFKEQAPERLSGYILLRVEDKGQAYYVNPGDCKLLYLGRPSDAFRIMRERSLGISNRDIKKIPLKTIKLSGAKPIVASIESTNIFKAVARSENEEKDNLEVIEQAIFRVVNEYRNDKGLASLKWNDDIAQVSRNFSDDLGSGKVVFSHDGFSDRMKEVSEFVIVRGMAENIAYNSDFNKPAQMAVNQWLNSPGHKKNIEGDYKMTGIGVARNKKGYNYFTQIFVK